jgi:diguanylate cyclase (GGDEF)-like protein
MWRDILLHGVWSGEIYNRRKDGAVYPEWLTISALRDERGEVSNFIGSFADLTQLRATESRVHHLAHFDPLTGLPNHTVLQDRTAHAISMAQRVKESLCLLHLSIDHFKSINESHGHGVGDMVLTEVARRLSAAVREQDTVSHHAGKEFTLLLPSTGSDGAAHLAGELLWKLAQPYVVGGQQIGLTASIGIASWPENGDNFEALLKCAEIAVHRAQSSGRDNFKFYSDAMYQEVVQREQMARALREAVECNAFTVVYQPLADFQSGGISGMEALIRWTHPQLGPISPAVFIPLAEETGAIRAIGQWVLGQVCRDIRAWSDQGLNVPRVAVNVSAVQFRDPQYLANVRSVLQECGVEPGRLFLEVTESALMDDVQRCETVLAGLKDMGFGLSLDDFGTGYSSLSYLKRYPFDKVKIDQSFVRDIDSNEVDSVLVKVIIAMAHGLGLKVVAEGVETEKQCEIMRSNVCDEIQGYFLSRPVDAVTLGQLLAQGHSLPGHLLRFRPPQRTMLLVDDEPNVVSALKRLFRRDGHLILTANSGDEGLQVLAQAKVDVIISDQRMPGMTGVEFLREAKKRYPDTIRIVLSGYTELQSVTDAINEGAIYRFLTKPWVDEQLREQVHKAFEHVELLEQNRQLDIKIRTTNQELMAANRHLGALIEATRRQVQTETASLAVLREALQLIPTPILGVDDQQVIMFTNDAADQALVEWGGLLGCPLQDLDAQLPHWMAASPQGQGYEISLAGQRWNVGWRRMGKTSASRGSLLSLQPLPALVQVGTP